MMWSLYWGAVNTCRVFVWEEYFHMWVKPVCCMLYCTYCTLVMGKYFPLMAKTGHTKSSTVDELNTNENEQNMFDMIIFWIKLVLYINFSQGESPETGWCRIHHRSFGKCCLVCWLEIEGYKEHLSWRALALCRAWRGIGSMLLMHPSHAQPQMPVCIK